MNPLKPLPTQRTVLTRQIARGSALLTLGTFVVVLSLLGTHPDQAQSGTTLPPTWTPAAPATAAPVQPTIALSIPTLPPTPTVPAVYSEQAVLSAPLFFLSKHGSPTQFLARTDPGATASTNVSKTGDNVTAFDVSADGQVAYGTDKGTLMVPGRQAWQAPSAHDPMSITSVSWSPDAQTVAFTLRSSAADFQTNAKQEASGVYLWKTGDAQPSQFIADLVTGTGQYQYTVQSWSPDGTLLLIKYAETVSKSYGWITASINPKNSYGVATFKPGDATHYQSANWTSDNAVMVFNQATSDPTPVSGGLLVDQNGNRSRPLAVIDPLDKAPILVSDVHFLSGNDVFVLGSLGYDKPLQPYSGSYSATNATITVKPIAQAFKLKWPGAVITSQGNYPIYIVDDQYGVVLFKDGSIFSYYPTDLAMNATDSTVYDQSFYPDWKFVALGKTPKLP